MRSWVAVGLGVLVGSSGVGGLSAQTASGEGEIPWRTLVVPSAGQQGTATLCILSPRSEWGGDRRPLVWHLQPALVWRGELGRVELAEEATGRIVWSQRVNTQGFLACGIALQPSRSYTWLVYDTNDLLTHAVSFQTLGTEARQRLLATLTETKRTGNKSAPDPETQAWERVRTLSQQKLWADVLQKAHSIDNPSPALSRFLQNLEQSLCGSLHPKP
ncbi:MAG: hypothetical protein ACUVSQ_10985 [Pseudanabaenaceae cyanobacterium]